MNTLVIYKAIKAQLTAAPCFYFLGQYLKSADQTSYKVPALYVEMPKPSTVTYFGKIKAVKNAQFKIHVLNNAPWKGNDTTNQDTALAAHEALKQAVSTALQGVALKDSAGLYLTQQMIETGSENMQYDGPHVFSILTFQCDFYDRSTG